MRERERQKKGREEGKRGGKQEEEGRREVATEAGRGTHMKLKMFIKGHQRERVEGKAYHAPR